MSSTNQPSSSSNDLLTAIDGVTFDDAWNRRTLVQLDTELSVDVLSWDDFIANKRASGRPKDLADIDQLENG